MGTRRWAISSAADSRIEAERKAEEARLNREADEYLAELRAYEAIDEGLAYEVEGIEYPGY